MENKDCKRISRSGLSFVIFCVLTGWILDVLSSWIGLGIRIHVPGGVIVGMELSPFFLVVPGVWMILLVCLAVSVYLFKGAPLFIKQLIFFWIIIFSYLPSVRNTILLLEVVL